jgi:hypothetical protein
MRPRVSLPLTFGACATLEGPGVGLSGNALLMACLLAQRDKECKVFPLKTTTIDWYWVLAVVQAIKILNADLNFLLVACTLLEHQ